MVCIECGELAVKTFNCLSFHTGLEKSHSNFMGCHLPPVPASASSLLPFPFSVLSSVCLSLPGSLSLAQAGPQSLESKDFLQKSKQLEVQGHTTTPDSASIVSLYFRVLPVQAPPNQMRTKHSMGHYKIRLKCSFHP